MTEEESNLVQHARRELALLGNGPEMNDHILEMIKIFSGAGHSGYSGFYAIGVITKLLNFENLTDLTDDPDEWHHHEYDQSGYTNGIWQNVRNGEAFSFDGGKTYYLLSERIREKLIFHNSKPKEGNMAIHVSHKKFKHTSSGEIARAVRVTEGNFVNVANWCGGMAISKVDSNGDVSRQRVRLKNLIAQRGDFIVRVEKGIDEATKKPVFHFFRVKQLDFFEQFQPA